MPIKALVLDKEGVVFDINYVYKKALLQTIKALNINFSESLISQLLKSQNKNSVLAQELRANKINQEEFLLTLFLQRDEIITNEGMPFVNGVEELIIYAKNKALPVVLVTDEDSESNLLDFQNSKNPALLRQFDLVITAENIHFPKPHPEIYQLVSQRLHIPATDILVIEDSASGANSSLEAGAQTLLLVNEYDENSSIRNQVKALLPNLNAAKQYF